MKRFFVILLIACFGSQFVNAQSMTPPDIKNDLIPPSPDAASLGKFGIIPVSLYTGMPNVSVPVYELKSNKLTLPVSLAYNNNGYRPGEESSFVGLGWTLQAGGVITRVVKGQVDESTDYPVHWQQYPNLLDMTNNMDYMQYVINRQADTEPDLYIFNFNGHSGKFIMVGNRAYLFPYQDLKIVQVVNGFSITAEDGVAYFFQDQETTTPNNSQSAGNPQSPYTSAWYLTKIVSTDNTDEIDFQYTMWSHRQSNAEYQETYQQKRSAACGGSNSNCDVWTTSHYVGAFITAKRLTGITCPGGYINFIPETTLRQDLNSVNAYGLKEIDIFQPNNKMIKKMSLIHDYFKLAGTPTQLKLSSLNMTGYYVNSIMGTGGIDSISIPNYYTFQYNNESGSFPKSTRGIDNYGYYNGKGNSSLFDASITSYSPACPVADRTVNVASSVIGTLSKMTYPTGGYTNFSYEGNLIGTAGQHQQTQNQSAGGTVIGNGVDTIFQIFPFSCNHTQTASITYGRDISNYPTGGILNNTLILELSKLNPATSTYQIFYTSPRLNKALGTGTVSITLDSGAYKARITCEATSKSVFAQINYYKLLFIPYSGDPGPGVRIKSIQSYDGLNTVVPAMTKNYYYDPGILLSAPGYGYNSVIHYYNPGGPICGMEAYTENCITSSYSSSLSTLLSDQYYYPKVAEVNHDSLGAGKTVYTYSGDGLDAMNVWLTNQTEYKYLNGGYVPAKSKTNTYTQSDYIDFWAFTYNMGAVIDPGGCVPWGLSTNQYDTLFRSASLNTSSYALSSMYNYLAATDEASYDQNGQNPLTVHTDYYYDNPLHVQPTRTVVANSKGYLITTQVKYPLDYSYTSCTSLYKIDSSFKAARDQAHATYGTSVIARNNYIQPYYDPAIFPNTANANFMTAIRAFTPKCEAVSQASYASAISSMNSGVLGYYSCLLNAVGLPTPQSAITLLQHHNVTSIPIEQIVSINKSGIDYLYGANKTDYGFNYSFSSVTPIKLYQTGFTSTSTLKSDFMANPGNYYQQRVSFKYDPEENIIQQSKINDINMSYIWDYHKMYPVAQVSNADSANIAYTSFEADGSGNWVFVPAGQVTTVGGVTGSKSYSLTSGAITKTGLTTTKTYIISFWLKTGSSASITGATVPTSLFSKNGWTYFESTTTSSSAVSITGTGNLDELRLFPSDAQMTTYAYDPLVGITNACSPTNQISNYFYDPLARLKYIKDADGNIIKTIDYHFQIQ